MRKIALTLYPQGKVGAVTAQILQSILHKVGPQYGVTEMKVERTSPNEFDRGNVNVQVMETMVDITAHSTEGVSAEFAFLGEVARELSTIIGVRLAKNHDEGFANGEDNEGVSEHGIFLNEQAHCIVFHMERWFAKDALDRSYTAASPAKPTTAAIAADPHATAGGALIALDNFLKSRGVAPIPNDSDLAYQIVSGIVKHVSGTGA